jgi:hypothetical protein
MSQGKNRFAFQTGLLHEWFDDTPLINSEKTSYGNAPNNMFGGYLNDSWGFMYEREINEKSSISVEYMRFETSFFMGDYAQRVNPFISKKDVKLFNISYNRKKSINTKINLIYGGGLNYLRGTETIFLKNDCNFFGCTSFVPKIRRGDIGLNIRSGVEYELLDWLTIYTNIDFLGIFYWEGQNNFTDLKSNKYLKDNYNLKNIPSRFDLSLRFGVGINFQ